MNNTPRIFEKYFSPRNLRLAWERMVRSTGRDTKDFFGIELFSIDLDNNLKRLSELVLSGRFKPSRPFKYLEPKVSRTHRTKTVLGVEDALVYQAIADTVAAANYKRMEAHNQFVYGSVLHPEVEKGLALLDEEDPEFFFFQYYLPLYNKFVQSINTELDDRSVRFKFETDITGFFDAIPHSKLLLTLHKFGVEPEILDLLGECLNLYSGTKESLTPGVGIPQGPPPSLFFANLLLFDLDNDLSQDGYVYYRYMDDIRIYEATEAKLTDALVKIDNFLKGRGLSLNTKKTSIDEIGENREAEKMQLLTVSGAEETAVLSLPEDTEAKFALIEQGSDGEQEKKSVMKAIRGDELIAFCKKEIEESEKILLEKFGQLGQPDFNARNLLKDETLKKDIVTLAYRWRSANSILNDHGQPVLDPRMIEIWLFCLEHFFWKANHFCWNLNQYGPNEQIAKRLEALVPVFHNYEWVRYQILSNLATAHTFSITELQELFRKGKAEPSGLVRMGYYTILLKHLKPTHQLYASLRTAIREDREPYLKNHLSSCLFANPGSETMDEIKYWFGL